MLKPLEMGHMLLSEIIEVGDLVVDATMGNGYDTEFLATLSNNVVAFDVQEQAFFKTKDRLEKAGLVNQTRLILDGHENIAKYIHQPVKAAIFNLGYLPGADKTIVTKPETTIPALDFLTKTLTRNGRIMVMIYGSHDGSLEEKSAVFDWAAQLDQKIWHVARYNMVNEAFEPPILLMLVKS